MKSIRNVLLLSLSAVICMGAAQAAPMQRNGNTGNYYVDENAQALKDIRGTVDRLRHEVGNHETEIRMYDEKLNNLESIIESVRDQLNDTAKVHKEQLKGSSTSLEERIAALDAATAGLMADLRQFKTFATESNTVLGQYKQRISDLERVVEQQNQNIDHLQAAMRAMMDALQVKDAPSFKAVPELGSADAGPTTLYRIKAGDSLEKIARANKTTVQAIKQLNGMTNDKIVVGKQIKIPETN